MKISESGEKFKLIDITYLLDAADNSAELVLEVIQIFKSQLPDFETRIIGFIEHRDIVGLKKTTHKIRSAMNVLGVTVFNEQLSYFDKKKPDELNVEEFALFLAFFNTTCKDILVEIDQVIDTFNNKLI